MQLRKAVPSDAPRLTAIAFAAKWHWGYPEAWIQRWSDALTITPEYIATNVCFAVIEEPDEILGFAALRKEAGEFWLDHLWLLPAAMGRGIGRMLFERCEAEAKNVCATRLRIEADPHAEEFYARMGARTVSRVSAAMDGAERFLPMMEKALG